MDTVAALGLQDNPLITGLWQIADLERGGQDLDIGQASQALLDYAKAGFTCFDMADHYGSAELIAGAMRATAYSITNKSINAEQIRLYTKWCPTPDQCSEKAVRSGIEDRLRRLNVACIDLLQLHWWQFQHPGYIPVMEHLAGLQQEGLIEHIGLTNFDTDHLHVLLAEGYPVIANQVCISVLDQRALGDMSTLCQQSKVRLLAYGTLAGGFLNERWLGTDAPANITDWSKMKYGRFIEAAGGWDNFQCVLAVLDKIARKHQVSIANVATRWVLQQPMVAGVIVGARITQAQHRDSNKQTLLFTLDAEDMNEIAQITQQLNVIPGDCGAEYRRAPFLTASGDLSHHLEALPSVYDKQKVPGREQRWRIDTGSEFEAICGYSRAVRDGNRVVVSGTTATHGDSRVIGQNDVRAQTVYILDKIAASLESLGSSLSDVIRTRIYLTDSTQWEAVSRVHGRYFADIQPANTLIEVRNLVGPYSVEIEAEAVIAE